MSLARDRDWYFVLPFATSVALAVFSFGLIPLAMFRARVDRWRRLEGTQRAEVGRWIADHRAPLVGRRLADDAERAAAPAGFDFFIWIVGFVVAALVGCFVYATAARGVAPIELLWPGSGRLHPTLTMAHSLAAIGWAWATLRARDLFPADDGWIETLNRWITGQDQRPVIVAASGRRTRWGWGVTPLAWPVATITGSPVWMLVIPISLLAWNDAIVASRGIRLQLIARMLELMDEGPVAMEYDVEALEPEAIAAMIA